MADNMTVWGKVEKPPATALKTIKGGRINGMTDIKPQWRLRVLTETFGPVGTGWSYTIDKLWTEPGSDNQVCAFALVGLKVKNENEWSEPVPGIGGSMLVTKEKAGLHTSDECYKMAVTDAISVAAKAFGVAAAIYEGMWDGSKYKDEPKESAYITAQQAANINALISDVGADPEKFGMWLKTWMKSTDVAKIPANQFDTVISTLESKRGSK